MAEPTDLPIFDENDTNTIPISTELQDDGFSLRSKPASGTFNSWFRNVYKWTEWFQEKFGLVDAAIDKLAPVDSIAALKAITYTPIDGQVVKVLGYYAKTENRDWSFQWVSGNLSTEVAADTQSGIYVGVTAIATTAGAFVRLWSGYGEATWFGMTDAGDQLTYVQSAIDAICGLSASLYIPPGNHKLSGTLTVPNQGWTIFGDAGTSTGFSEVTGSGQIVLLDLDGITGPAATVRNLIFSGPTTGGLGGVGINLGIDNGVVIQSCWFTGLTNGILKGRNASFVSVLDCVFEFNFGALVFSDGVQCMVANNTFYQNSYDYYFDGDFSASVFTGASFIETKIACMYLDGVIDGSFSDMSCRQDFDQQLPIICDVRGASKRNQINNLRTKSFGTNLVKMSAEANTDNTFTNISSILIAHIPPAFAPPTGTLVSAIEVGLGSDNNTFNGFKILGTQYGIVNSGDNNQFLNGTIDGTTVNGVLLAGADESSFINVEFKNNTLDWATSGTVPTVWVESCGTTLTGLTPTRLGTKGSGVYDRVFYGAVMPTSLSYVKTDFVKNVAQTVDANAMVLTGWYRATTGSNHVIDVDWWPMYISVLSPAN